ncbi:hypothetical protein ACER0C_001081 [Sarotherodon galilaeus]
MALQQLVCCFSVMIVLFFKGCDSKLPDGAKIILTGSGSTRCSGRVEIYHNNNWVSVSDYNWDLNDAEVVCRQLNCGTALEAPRSAHFRAETEQIWLDNVKCSGNESSLNECQHSEFGRHKCGYDRNARVICSDLIRLAGSGSTRCSGRVEIYHKNIWGRVSDNGWDLNDAEVVCRQLNCGTALEAPHSAYFGAGTGQIWLDNVACSGTETSLTECKHSGFGSHSCGHGQDAGVICSDLIRLAGSGSTRCSGRVEVYHKNIWGTVSDYNWDLNDADVVCRQINCGSALDALQLAYFGEGTGQIWLSDVTCSGNESSLTECEHSGWGNYYYGHYYDTNEQEFSSCYGCLVCSRSCEFTLSSFSELAHLKAGEIVSHSQNQVYKILLHDCGKNGVEGTGEIGEHDPHSASSGLQVLKLLSLSVNTVDLDHTDVDMVRMLV